jgi:hypothetical protein
MIVPGLSADFVASSSRRLHADCSKHICFRIGAHKPNLLQYELLQGGHLDNSNCKIY